MEMKIDPLPSFALSLLVFLTLFYLYEMTSRYLIEALLFGLIALPAILFLNSLVEKELDDLLPLFVGLFIAQLLVYLIEYK